MLPDTMQAYLEMMYQQILHRAVVGGPAGQAMAGPVLGLTKQYIGLEIVINLSNYIAAYASTLLVHCLEFYFALSYDKYQFFRLWNPCIHLQFGSVDCGIHL